MIVQIKETILIISIYKDKITSVISLIFIDYDF